MVKGDYVRTKNLGGSIEKVIDIKEDILTKEKKKYYATDISALYSVRITDEDIIKSSPNIIDLIEVGDYVNGNKIIKISKDHCERTILIYGYDDGNRQVAITIYEDEIKSIVTKEMFANAEYRVETN